eukprot:CAMPEP_0115859534 /NCGR_PEP_ID=MMETSP0287-20121206/16664_1 /TAXON_ID=412157 /ORGANISM="Chrysochromulina rotalis, Strain UIO044" /LENGTH=181 /DNA_ID=CAMNT_0003313835 /DNA_START=18 /DNA_END=563 /DNA_ORIENTATION=-
MCSAKEPTAASRFQNLGRLERRLADAVDDEDYAAAASIRDELARLRVDADVGVLSANSEFYRAFSENDEEKMAELWQDDDSVMCAHPGFAPIYGHENVVESWRQIFSSGASPIGPKNVRVQLMRGGMAAMVTCVEVILSEGDSQLVATNLFEKGDDDRWHMMLHHAGPLLVGGDDEEDDSE